MKCFCTLAFLTLSWWLLPLVQAQPQDFSFEQVRLPGGSTSNFVNEVAQDRQGFLWLATRAWLIKYDGYETTTSGPRIAYWRRRTAQRASGRRSSTSLVISDVMMPEMDGFALCTAIKADAALSHIPFVLLTARADEESRLEGLGAGADDFLPKPFSLEELTARVENLIEIRRRLRERFSASVRLGPAEILVSSANAAFVERMRDVVDVQMGDSQFDVSRLADELGLSERQLHRRVKETAAGLTPAGYIRMMRLERAAHLLRQDAGRVSEIAYAVGFRSAKHFSRLFRQTFGHAPSDEAGADLP